MTVEQGRESALSRSFVQLFEFLPALDDLTRDQVFRIRHDVYCKELGWEPTRPDERETDPYDSHAIQCLLRRRGSQEPVGCVRLILTQPHAPDDLLPFEATCAAALDRKIADPSSMPRNTVGEVSRLAVLSRFRQRRGEDHTSVSVAGADFATEAGHARFPFIPVGLYLGVAALAIRFGIENTFVLTEPRLAGHFARIGLDIRIVGNCIEHRGQRAPAWMRASHAVTGLRPMIRPLFDAIYRDVTNACDQRPDGRFGCADS